MRRAWELLRLALGNIRRSPLRVTLTTTGIAIATGALVSMVGFAFGVQERVEEPFQKMELVNRIDVRPKQPTDQATRDRTGRSLDDAALTRMTALPGVLLVYPDFRLETVRVGRGDRETTSPAIGLPPEAVRLRFVRDALLAGQFFDPSRPREVVLGRRLAEHLGFATPAEAVGQPLTLQAKGMVRSADGRFQVEEQQHAVVVAGVWDPPSGRHGFSPDGLVLPTDLIRGLPGVGFDSTLERLLHGKAILDYGYGRVVVRVKHPSDLFGVEEQIQGMGYQTQTLLGQFKEMRTGFVLIDLILTAVGTVALVVAGLGIINTLLMAVLERYREIGTYKALGASDGDVRLLFLAEAGLVGFLGGLGGLVLGRVVSWAIEVLVNALARSKGIDEPVMAFAFPWPLLAGAVLFALLVSVVSGVYPAGRAARVDPIRALRGE
jgi:putative ABC transport system permease protein